MPRFASWATFNDYLKEQCLRRQVDVLRSHKISIGERMQADLAAMQSLPAAPFEACDLRSGQVTSTSVVRYRGNDYSVPVAFDHREVWIRGFVDRVVIGCAAEVIAEHVRSYERDDITFDPVHYLRLIERKIMAFDQAAPLQNWDLPDAFATVQRRLEARQGKAGKREYVQVLRLLERFEMAVLHGAVRDALRLGAISFDAIKHLVLCRVEQMPPRLDLDVYPFLPSTTAATTSARSYLSLLGGGGRMNDVPELLLVNHLKTLRLPTFLREHDKQARICAAEGVDHVRNLARLTELELIDRERHMVERRIKSAKFPAVKSLDSFDFKAIPSLNKMMVLELARCDWIERRENVIALGPSGTGKTHVALGLGLAACQKGMPVSFVTAASQVHELMEARDEKRLLRLQRQLAKVETADH